MGLEEEACSVGLDEEEEGIGEYLLAWGEGGGVAGSRAAAVCSNMCGV